MRTIHKMVYIIFLSKSKTFDKHLFWAYWSHYFCRTVCFYQNWTPSVNNKTLTLPLGKLQLDLDFGHSNTRTYFKPTHLAVCMFRLTCSVDKWTSVSVLIMFSLTRQTVTQNVVNHELLSFHFKIMHYLSLMYRIKIPINYTNGCCCNVTKCLTVKEVCIHLCF